ncbi:MAG: hypothetical protein KKF89_05680 [Nanoarchaeota archaeon]|nr:hypothetical protein [Nanoarchaeota archaeon]MBU1855187.1 hypothetical protein [Nanoarchaeota archaeon]
MLELSIPQIGDETRNAKDLVFTILTKESPLSLIELSNKIRTNYTLHLTYQAVRKAVDKLHEQGVLKKNGKRYSISKEWVMSLRSFFDKLLLNYESGKKSHTFTAELAKENYAVYTFDNLLDLDYFWGDMLMYVAKHIGEDEPKIAMNCGTNVWWLLINLGRETSIYVNHTKNKIDTYFLWLKDYPLNHWAVGIYEELGFKSKVLELPDADDFMTLDTIGDTVIQVVYSKEIAIKIKNFFEKYKTTQEMSMKEITELAHSKCEIKFIVFKNPTIAKNIRDTYIKYFN